VLARRRRDGVASALVVTALVAGVAGLVSAIRTPTDPLGAFAAYQTRWLWPMAAFLSFAVVATLARALAQDPRRYLPLVAGFTALTVVLVVLNLPTGAGGSDAANFTQPIVRDLNRQMADLDHAGTLYVDWHDEPHSQVYGSAALAELDRRGIPFKVRDQDLVRSLGTHRRFTGHNADAALRVRTGDDVDHAPPGSRRIAYHEALRPAQLHELSALKQQIAAHIRRDGLRLTRSGLAAIRRLGATPPAAPSSTDHDSTAKNQAFNPNQLFASRGLVSLLQHHFLVLTPHWKHVFNRYLQLQVQRDTRTVALFLRPFD
jgi:hypothetical protein